MSTEPSKFLTVLVDETPIKSEVMNNEGLTCDTSIRSKRDIKFQGVSQNRSDHPEEIKGFGGIGIFPNLLHKDTEDADPDNLLHCPECEAKWAGNCPLHGPLHLAEDVHVAADVDNRLRAESTVPYGVAVSSSPEGRKFAYARLAIPIRTRFGPYEGEKVAPEVASPHAWLIRKDGQPDYCIDAKEPGLSNWMRYVESGPRGSNLLAYQYHGELYYMTTRAVSPGEKLHVYCGFGYQLPDDPHQDTDNVRSIKQEIPDDVMEYQSADDPHQDTEAVRSVKLEPDIMMECPQVPDAEREEQQTASSGRSADRSPVKMGVEGELRGVWGSVRVKVEAEPGDGQPDGQPHDQPDGQPDGQPHNQPDSESEGQPDGESEGQPICESDDQPGGESEGQRVCESDDQRGGESEGQPGGESDHQHDSESDGQQDGSNGNVVESRLEEENPHLVVVPEVPEEFEDCANDEQDALATVEDPLLEFAQNCSEGPPSEMFACTDCNKLFRHKWRLNLHLKTHNGGKPFVCELCKKEFARRSSLTHHLRAHGDKRFGCDKCGQRFTREAYLKRHLLEHLGVKPFKCDQCIDSFTTRSSLYTHQKTHKGRKSCPKCLKVLPSDVELKVHSQRSGCSLLPYLCTKCQTAYKSEEHECMPEHEGGELWHCGVCKDQCDSKRELLKHYADLHTPKNAALCKECDRLFANPDVLRTHVRRVHSKERPYVCAECDKGFFTAHDLAKHEDIHAGKLPLRCLFCKLTARSQAELTKHMDVHKNALACPHCDNSYSTFKLLQRHIRKKHEGQTESVSDLNSQVESPSLTEEASNTTKTGEECACQKCNKMLSSKLTLRRHLRGVHKLYACKKCDEYFTSSDLERHRCIPNAKRALVCKCNTQFRNKTAYNAHIKGGCGVRSGNPLSKKSRQETPSRGKEFAQIQSDRSFEFVECSGIE